MNELKGWLDRITQRLCEWLDDFFPGDHGLAILGDGLAGLERVVPLPVDRRMPSNVLLAHSNGGEMQSKSKAGGGLPAHEWSCNFWAYCHMSGAPCVWCRGRNSLSYNTDYMNWGKDTAVTRDLCPSGKASLNAWYGCCKDTNGRLILIAFVDCCGPGFCYRLARCKNWPDAKNWCTYQSPPRTLYVHGVAVTQPGSAYATDLTGPNSYYCTVAVSMGESCTD